jgi:ribosomal protein S18 acetylase RimI-like enzyme
VTVIRRAGPADAAALATIGRGTFVETFGHLYAAEDLATFLAEAHSEAAYARLLAEPGVASWLAGEAGEPPVGYLVAGPCKLPVPAREPRAGEIRRMYLWRSAQSRGLGTRLLEQAFAWLDESGLAPVYVGVWSNNSGAQRLYARFGFEKVGEYDFPVGRHIDREFILRRR